MAKRHVVIQSEKRSGLKPRTKATDEYATFALPGCEGKKVVARGREFVTENKEGERQKQQSIKASQLVDRLGGTTLRLLLAALLPRLHSLPTHLFSDRRAVLKKSQVKVQQDTEEQRLDKQLLKVIKKLELYGGEEREEGEHKEFCKSFTRDSNGPMTHTYLNALLLVPDNQLSIGKQTKEEEDSNQVPVDPTSELLLHDGGREAPGHSKDLQQLCQMVSGKCQMMSGRCQMVSGTCQMVSERCQMVSGRSQMVSRRSQMVLERCQMVSGRCQMV